MALFVANNSGENHWVDAPNKERALWLIEQRLKRMFGKYNITDIKMVTRKMKEVSTFNADLVNKEGS